MLDFVLKSDDTLDKRIAVIDQGEGFDFASLQRLSHRLAQALSLLDTPPGDRIAVLLPNSLHAVVAFLAAAQMGRSYLPLNTGLKPAELKSLFHQCGVGVVLCRASMQSRIPEGVHILAVDEVLDEVGEGKPFTKEAKLDSNRPFVCLSTSGSTGTPRIVERTARAVYSNVQRVSAELQVNPKDCFISVVPFWHANGFSNCLLMPLSAGASIIPMERFLPRTMLDLIIEKKPSVVIGSPFIFRALAQIIEPGSELSHVRAWVSSGAALPAELDERLRDLEIRVRQLYGSSETGTISISSEQKACPGNVGKPLPGVRMRIVGDQGRELPAGQPGQVQVASTSLFSSYVGNANGMVDVTEDGFYRMQDRGELDGEGNLNLTGRTDTLINVAGIKVDPREIQMVLDSMPGVRQSIVFGVQDANGMEMVKALLVVKKGIDTQDILQYCRGQLAEYKLPRTIEFTERIPQDLMGKTTRSLLEH